MLPPQRKFLRSNSAEKSRDNQTDLFSGNVLGARKEFFYFTDDGDLARFTLRQVDVRSVKYVLQTGYEANGKTFKVRLDGHNQSDLFSGTC